MNIKSPIVVNMMELMLVKKIHTVHVTEFIKSSVLRGFSPSHHFVISNPHIINQRLKNPQMNPHTSTDTRESPYGSIRDINTHPRKLLNIEKNIRAKSPPILLTIFIVPARSIFLCSSW